MFKASEDPERIKDFIVEKIKNAKIAKKLTIIDGYFFSNGAYSFVLETVVDIVTLLNGKIKELHIVTSNSSYNERNLERLEKKLPNLSITVTKNNLFHDRFWIIDDKLAFVVGASINGFGKKHFFIQDDFLSERDTVAIMEMYTVKE